MRDYFIFHTDSRTNDVYELKIWEDHYPLYKKHENLVFRDPGDGHIYIGGKNKLKFATFVAGTKPNVAHTMVLRCRSGDQLDLRGTNWAWCSRTEFAYKARHDPSSPLEPGLTEYFTPTGEQRFRVRFTPPGGKPFKKQGFRRLGGARKCLNSLRIKAGLHHLNERYMDPVIYHTEEGEFEGVIESAKKMDSGIRLNIRVAQTKLVLPWEWHPKYYKIGLGILARISGRNLTIQGVLDGAADGVQLQFEVKREGNHWNSYKHRAIP